MHAHLCEKRETKMVYSDDFISHGNHFLSKQHSKL